MPFREVWGSLAEQNPRRKFDKIMHKADFPKQLNFLPQLVAWRPQKSANMTDSKSGLTTSSFDTDTQLACSRRPSAHLVFISNP